MNITASPNLKGFQDYSEHDVINMYAHVSGSVNRGTFVGISAALGNTNVTQGQSSPATPHLNAMGSALSSNTPSYANVYRPEVRWKVSSAVQGDIVLGMTLVDVREVNAWGEKVIFKPRYERSEQDIVASGEAVPVVTKGVFKINGFSGTPGPGSGAIIGAGANQGKVVVSAYQTSGVKNAYVVGKFLSSADADGYALFKLEL